MDQALHQHVDGADQWLYGSDYNEKENWFQPPYNYAAIVGSNTYFNANGIVAADRKPHPSYYEVKKVYAEMKVEAKDLANGVFTVKNKQLFSDLSAIDLCYVVTEDGEKIAEGRVAESAYADLAPLSQRDFTLSLDLPETKGEVLLTFSFLRKAATRWADKGFEQTFDQFLLREAAARPEPENDGKVTITGTEKSCVVTGDGFTYRFENGMLVSLQKGDEQYLLSGFKPNYYRALTDNDIDYFNFAPPLKFASPHYAWTRATDNARTRATFIHQFSHGALIETSVSVSGLKNAKVIYRIFSSGAIEITHEGTATRDMLRFGLKFELPRAFDRVCWYGRGPQENYIDRKTGARIGKYCMTVGELEHHYMRPQENGHRTDVRKLEIASADGKALRLTATGGKPFAFNCFHYTIDALDKATHIHSFGHMDLTTVCIDEQQRGVGGDMPGSATLRDPYIMHKGTDYKFSFLLETVAL